MRRTEIKMFKRRTFVLLFMVAYFCFLAALLIRANRAFFDSNAVFTQDYAGTAQRVFHAKSLHRLYGVDSWTGIATPGPIYFYWRALFEYIGDALGVSYIRMALVSQVVLVLSSGIGTVAILNQSSTLGLGLSGGLVTLALASEAQNNYHIVTMLEPYIPIHLMLPYIAAVYVASAGSVGSAIVAVILALWMVQIQVSTAYVALVTLVPLLASFLIYRRNLLAAIRELSVSARILSLLGLSLASVPFIVDALRGFPNTRGIIRYAAASRALPSPDPSMALQKIGEIDAGWIAWFGDYFGTMLLAVLTAAILFRVFLSRLEDELMKLFGLALIVVVAAYGVFRVGPSIDYSPPHLTAFSLAGVSVMMSVLAALFLGRLLGRFAEAVPIALIGVAFVVSGSAYGTGKMTYPLAPAPTGIIVSKPLIEVLRELEKARPKAVVIEPAFPADLSATKYRERDYPYSIAQTVANAMTRASISFCLPPQLATSNVPQFDHVLGASYCSQEAMSSGERVTTYCEHSRLFIKAFGKATDITQC